MHAEFLGDSDGSSGKMEERESENSFKIRCI
jgi:hypothetical protein